MAQMIGEILVQKGYITQQQVDGVLAVKGPDAQVGQVLIEWGLLTQEQLMEALEIQAPPPPPTPILPPPPVQPVYQPPAAIPAAPPPPSGGPDLSMDKLQTSKFKIDLKTLIFVGSMLVSGVTMYFTFMSELDSRFGELENTDDTVMVELDKRLTVMETDMDKRLTELENKFTPIGDGVYAVDPNSSWPPSRGEYKMKDELSRTKIVELEKEIARILKDIEKIEKKVFNGSH